MGAGAPLGAVASGAPLEPNVGDRAPLDGAAANVGGRAPLEAVAGRGGELW